MTLYEYYVHGIGIKTPPLPLYYPKEFFNEIKTAEIMGHETISMKVRDWYDLLIKENMTHTKENNELILKKSRMEILYPHINHKNSFQNIRKIGLPSSKMSPLWKLKYDLYLTEERKKYCKIAANNRCQKCQKMDSTGHFLLCTKSNSQKIYGKFLEHCHETDPNLTTEKLIHMDINGKSEEIYAIGWVLATLTKAHFSKNICKNMN